MSSPIRDSLWPGGPARLADTGDPGLAFLRREVREFLAHERADGSFVPVANSWMTGHDPSFSIRLADRGWIGMSIPRRYGGRGRTAVERHVVIEELLAAGAPVAAHWTADRQTSLSLLHYGTDEQRKNLLPPICAGKYFVCIGMSEPDAGSDLAAVTTRATRVEGGWRLTGTKVWTSGAQHAHAVVVLARSHPNPDSKHAGLTQFIVELPDPAVTVSPILLMDGSHHFNEVRLDSVFVPDSRVLGTAGQAWKQIMAELAWERGGPERFLSSFPLAEGVGSDARYDDHTVGRLRARAWALWHLAGGVAASLQAGNTPGMEAAVLKDLGTEYEVDLTTAMLDEMRVGPGDDPLANADLAAARVVTPFFTIRGGSSEVLREVIAREMSLRWKASA